MPSGEPSDQTGSDSYFLYFIKQMLTTTQNRKFLNFLLYALTFFSLGCAVISVGPLFPYLAAKNHTQEAQYSSLLIWRALGFSLGAFSVSFVENKLSFHQFLMAGLSVAGFCTILFSILDSKAMLEVSIFLSGLGSGYIIVFVNVCMLEVFTAQELQKWLLFVHGSFGIGGLTGPFIVYLLSFKSFFLYGLLMLAIVPFLWIVPSPESESKPKPNVVNPSITQQLVRTQLPYISLKNKLLLASIFLVVVGQERIFSGWVSTYAVSEGFSTKEHATLYNSLYWVSITFFRFTLMLVKSPPASKFYCLAIIGSCQSLVSLFTVYHVNAELGLILSALVFGLSNSIMVPLLFMIPSTFNQKIKPSQNSHFSLACSLGEAVFTPIAGFFMAEFSFKAFFYSMGLVNLLALTLHYVTQKSFTRSQQTEMKLQSAQEMDNFG